MLQRPVLIMCYQSRAPLRARQVSDCFGSRENTARQERRATVHKLICLPLSDGDCVTIDPRRGSRIHHHMLGNVVNYRLPLSGLEPLQGIVGCFVSQVDEPDGTILLYGGCDKEIRWLRSDVTGRR